ncbi:hypothetical protein VEIS1202513_13990 [Veillonella sp. S12025-13]|jgi:hypothetical protein|uniref:Uncharacterized protein n=1 Tax=Veillonella orientalis TaxID=2682455 RepID=A0ABM7HIF2_9FIRM|nr:hypothetical protein [Veillonella sp. S12025-13]BBU36878.1 hypothetical protein VEIS1202513_13990 [Veillonella sp. S12025-13]
MKVWSAVKSILNRAPFTVKFYIGFILLGFFILGLVTLHAYIKRPEQIQKLTVYEQKLVGISAYKVSEEHFATGRNGQIYIFKNTYEGITLETVKDMLSEEHITWRELKKRHLIGYDLDDKIEIEIIRDINTKAIIVKLEKDR